MLQCRPGDGWMVQLLSPAPQLLNHLPSQAPVPPGGTSFDQEEWTLLFCGESFHLKPLVKVIYELLPKAENESDNWDLQSKRARSFSAQPLRPNLHRTG